MGTRSQFTGSSSGNECYRSEVDKLGGWQAGGRQLLPPASESALLYITLPITPGKRGGSETGAQAESGSDQPARCPSPPIRLLPQSPKKRTLETALGGENTPIPARSRTLTVSICSWGREEGRLLFPPFDRLVWFLTHFVLTPSGNREYHPHAGPK